jgi:hypothetical protein
MDMDLEGSVVTWHGLKGNKAKKSCETASPVGEFHAHGSIVPRRNSKKMKPLLHIWRLVDQGTSITHNQANQLKVTGKT